MKVINCILLLSAVLGLTHAAAQKCYMAVDAKETTDCKAEETKCKMPKWVAYTGYAKDIAWGCGDCDANTEATCSSCDDDACNKPATSTSFECFSWTYKESKWTQATAKSTCLKSLESTKVMCNAPDRDLEGIDDTKYTAQASGCGPCSKTQKDAKGCLECESALCNGSTVISMSFLLAAASALVYLM